MKEIDIILKNIKNKELLPVYFFQGDESFYIDLAVKHFEQDVLEEDEKAFNQTVAYGRDTNYLEILSLARQYPMMGDKQLIIVKEAQDMKLNDDESKALDAYLQNPIPSTILVIAHKNKLDARKKITKTLSKSGMLFSSEKMKDYQLPAWIQGEMTVMGIKSAPNISHLLAEYLGNDLSRIANELNKLKIILKDGALLDGKIIEEHIGISKDFNIFELQKALATKDQAKAFSIAYYMGKNKKSNPVQMAFGALYNFFSNIIIYHTLSGQSPQTMASTMGVNPYAIKDYTEAARFYPLKHATRVISILREMDLKSKGVGVRQMEDEEIYKELVYKIIKVDELKVKV
ncbi:DNA polymerase III subunit delta [Epilithonimonas tenax]|uniref:DNA polymerase III subunit delta n=1 Tax=Epilithonimonas tenax TaxID=191577 RepID=UPI0004265356|nr:DNA polymerase III subunit delta [Epilithonimonas tenax]